MSTRRNRSVHAPASPHGRGPSATALARASTVVLSCSALLLGVLCEAEAQMVEASPADSARYRFPEVTTEAARTLTSAGGAAAVEVSAESLGVSAAPSVEEILRELPLLHVRTNSRGEAEVSARGSESRQVAVLVDGVPITLAWDARADVSVVPATGVQSVTFVRGLSSMLYGPNVLGGVLEAKVARSQIQPERTSTEVAIGGDHVGMTTSSVTTSIPWATDDGDWHLRGGLGFRNSPGDPLAGDLEEPLPGDDEHLRTNTDLEKVDGFASLRYLHGNGAWVAFSGSSFRLDRGIAAELGVSDEDARLWRYPHVARTLTVLSAGTGFHPSPLGGQGDVEASLGLDVGRTEIDAYTSRAYDEVSGFEDGKSRTLTLRLLADQTLGPRGDLRASFTHANVHYEESLPEGDATYEQRLSSFGLETDWKLVTGGRRFETLTLTVGGAHDFADTPESGGREALGKISEWGGRFGLSLAMNEGRNILHAGISRRGRFPALRELYSGALGRFQPNPELQPERLVTMEIGATTRFGTGEAQIAVFHNLLADAVVRTTLPDRRFFRVNRDELRSTGVELLGAQGLGPIDVHGSLTWQNVDITDTAADEEREPENLPEVLAELGIELPLQTWRFGVDVDYTGTQYALDAVTGEDDELEAAALLGVSVSRTWRPDLPWNGGSFRFLEARIAVDNLGDAVRYDAWGLPEPGRRARFELRLR